MVLTSLPAGVRREGGRWILRWALYAFICGPGSLLMCAWLTLTLTSQFSLPEFLLSRGEYLVQGVSRGDVRNCTDWEHEHASSWFSSPEPHLMPESPASAFQPVRSAPLAMTHIPDPSCEKARMSHYAWVSNADKALTSVYIVLVAVSVLMRAMAEVLIPRRY